MNFGPTEMLIVLVVVLLLFGSTRLPKLARSIGQASKEFKEGVKEGAADAKPDPNEPVTMTRAELDRLLAERDSNPSQDPPA